VRQAVEKYPSSINGLAAGTLLLNHIIFSEGNTRSITPMIGEKFGRTIGLFDTAIAQRDDWLTAMCVSSLAIGVLAIGIHFALAGFLLLSIGCGVYAYVWDRRAEDLMEKLQIQTVLEAQEYYVKGPLERAMSNLSRYNYNNTVLSEKQEAVRALQNAFMQIKQTDPQKAARLVIELFKGNTNHPEVQDLATIRENVLSGN
jgi:hypothetical protein